jgi:hypothetical protein
LIDVILPMAADYFPDLLDPHAQTDSLEGGQINAVSWRENRAPEQ